MVRLKTAALLLVFVLGGCAQLSNTTANNGSPTLSASEAQASYTQGLASYHANHPEAALSELSAAVASGQLRQSDAINARKHIAFIHCVNGRELQCREQFQAILKADPSFTLAANEASHPQWGPVWRSVKGASEEKLAVSRASSILATPAQQKLAEGITEYDAGRYKEALEALQAALKGGLPAQANVIRAHKYSAFIYCLTQKTRQCRSEFQEIFKLDPAFELLPSEAGHPSWSTVYRKEKTAAAKRQPKKK